MDVLSKHRGGLNAIARALLDNEIIDGAEVARLVDEAHGSPVHDEGAKAVPHFHEAAITAPATNGAGNGSGNGQHAVTDGSPGHEHAHEHGHHPVTDGTPGADQGPVAVPGHPADPETWAPPPWPPPTNPAAGAPEGPPTHSRPAPRPVLDFFAKSIGNDVAGCTPRRTSPRSQLRVRDGPKP